MVNLTTADAALKDVYGGIIANQLNIKASPLFAQIKRTNKDIYGKNIIKMSTVGINGGVGASLETAALPKASSSNYLQMKATLKNLYGQIEISDKAIACSQNNISAFVDLLAFEMEELVKASTFNLGRMMHGDGTGLVATITAVDTSTCTITCDSVQNLIEGMCLNVYDGDSQISGGIIKITYVNRSASTFTYDSSLASSLTISVGNTLYVQGGKDCEITGLKRVFDTSYDINGLSRSEHPWLTPYTATTTTEISDNLLQTVIDSLEENADSRINYILTTSKVRRAYQEYLTAYRRNVDIAELAGGFKTITYNGIPVVADRFTPEGTIYMLNTDDFTFYELGDWRWIQGEDGSVLKQNPNYATYTATLVKYGELMCERPCGQAMVSGVSDSVTSPISVVTISG